MFDSIDLYSRDLETHFTGTTPLLRHFCLSFIGQTRSTKTTQRVRACLKVNEVTCFLSLLGHGWEENIDISHSTLGFCRSTELTSNDGTSDTTSILSVMSLDVPTEVDTKESKRAEDCGRWNMRKLTFQLPRRCQPMLGGFGQRIQGISSNAAFNQPFRRIK
jgi:hypothetical protein